jgi:hypothetical protein
MSVPTDLATVLAVLDRLDRKRAAATPGPWTSDSHEIYQAMPGLPDHVNAGDWLGETCRIPGDPHHDTSAADAAVMVDAVNTLPALITAIRNLLLFADTIDGHDPRATSTAALIRRGITEALAPPSE